MRNPPDKVYVAYLDAKLSWMSFIIITFGTKRVYIAHIRITFVIYVLLHFIPGHFIKVMKRQGRR